MLSTVIFIAVLLVEIATPSIATPSECVGTCNSFWLQVSKERASYSEAVEACNKIGARLAVLDTEEKREEAQKIIEGCTETRRFWVGATERCHADGEERIFKWSTEKTVDGWCDDQPNDHEEHCVIFQPDCFHDYPCNAEYNYLCERVCPAEL